MHGDARRQGGGRAGIVCPPVARRGDQTARTHAPFDVGKHRRGCMCRRASDRAVWGQPAGDEVGTNRRDGGCAPGAWHGRAGGHPAGRAAARKARGRVVGPLEPAGGPDGADAARWTATRIHGWKQHDRGGQKGGWVAHRRPAVASPSCQGHGCRERLSGNHVKRARSARQGTRVRKLAPPGNLGRGPRGGVDGGQAGP